MSMGKKIVGLVEDPYSWYSVDQFRSSQTKKIYNEMLDDPNKIMSVLDGEDPCFFGGYILGYSLKKRLGSSGLIRSKDKSYSYLDPVKLAYSIGIYTDTLPEHIYIPGKKTNPFVERVQFGDDLRFCVYVSSLAYLSIPTIHRKSVKEMSLKELIENYRLSGRNEMFREEFMLRKGGSETEAMVNHLFPSVRFRDDKEDVYNQGRKGVSEAFRCFDLVQEKKKLKSFVMDNVKWEVSRYFKQEGRIPKSLRNIAEKIRPFVDQAEASGVPINMGEIAEHLGHTRETIKAAYKLLNHQSRQFSLDENVDDSEVHPSTYASLTQDMTSDAIDPARAALSRDFLAYVLRNLEPHEREWLIRNRLNGETLEDLGIEAGVSRARVQQLMFRDLDAKLHALEEEFFS